jgi:PIN domain nuclease of toxin-antitoxin system
LWWLADAPALSATAREQIATEEQVFVSSASVWEIAIKKALGKLAAPDELLDAIRADGFVELAISWAHAQRAGGLPPHHRDPFDRMLVAQAAVEDLVLVTADPAISPYGVKTVW